MKTNKIISIIAFGLLLNIIAPAYSQEKPADYKTACGFVKVTTNIIGYNFIAKHIAQNVIKKSLNKSIQGKYDVKLKSFSGVDLKKGKFKSLTIKGSDLCIDNEFYFSNFFLQTTSDFNYVDYKKKPMIFKADMPMKYSVEITEDDLNRTSACNNTITECLSFMPLVKIDNFKFKLDDNKLKISTAIHLPFSKPLKISIAGSPKIEDGKIVLDNVTTNGAKQEIADKLLQMVNERNLLDNINLSLFKGSDASMAVKNIKIIDKTIKIDGTLILKKGVIYG